MPATTRPLGQRTSVEYPIPQFSSWVTDLRVVTENDSNKDSIPAAEHIVLCDDGQRKGSRFALNTISLLAKLTGNTATIKLFIKEGGQYYLVRSDTITANILLKYENLPPLRYVVEVTALAAEGAVTISGGGTQ